jgi:hypothetical protein
VEAVANTPSFQAMTSTLSSSIAVAWVGRERA